jgi:hypothetical protein
VSAAALVAVVVGAFFLIGIGVGVVAVMALAATRRDAAVRGYPYDRDSYDRDSYDHGYEDDNERFRDLIPPATGLLARLPGPTPGKSGSRRFRGPLDCRALPIFSKTWPNKTPSLGEMAPRPVSDRCRGTTPWRPPG